MTDFRRLLLLFFVASATFFAACSVTEVPERISEIAKGVGGKRVMIVFVHGTVIPYFSPRSVISWCKDLLPCKKRKNRKRNSYVDKLKRFGVYRYQPIDNLGLHPIDPEKPTNKNDFKFFGIHTARLFKKMYDEVNPNHKDTLLFYSYNWTGNLCRKVRQKSGAMLYDALFNERKKNNADELDVYGHSHAMNVILNCAKEYQKRRCKEKLVIDKAAFFGGPVQSETEEFIHSPMFKKGIVHIVSDGDRIQVLDFISSKDFSARRLFGFGKKHRTPLPKNLCQIKVKAGIFRPLHRELWMWGSRGRVSFLYRKWLPIFPVPILVFAPAIISLASEIDATKDKSRMCSLSIDKNNQKMTLSCGTDQKIMRKLPISEIVDEGCSLL
jgi:hypothetical protein